MNIELPGPAWKLKEITGGFVIYQYATFRTNEELLIWRHDDGEFMALLSGTEGKDVTSRCPQEKWEAIYLKAIAAVALTGNRKPNIIEEIF